MIRGTVILRSEATKNLYLGQQFSFDSSDIDCSSMIPLLALALQRDFVRTCHSEYFRSVAALFGRKETAVILRSAATKDLYALMLECHCRSRDVKFLSSDRRERHLHWRCTLLMAPSAME